MKKRDKTSPYPHIAMRPPPSLDCNIFRQYSTLFVIIQQHSTLFDNIWHYSTIFNIIQSNSTFVNRRIMSKCRGPQFLLLNYVADTEKSHIPLWGGSLMDLVSVNPGKFELKPFITSSASCLFVIQYL